MYRILIIEDDESFINSIIDNFEDEKEYQFDSCNSSSIAMNKIKKNDYHLVLLDYYLKNETGNDVLKKIREISNVFICFLTGFSEQITPKLAFEMGIQGYIDKNGGYSNMINSIKSVIHSAYSANKKFIEPKKLFKIRLKKLREKHSLSQKELAEMLGVGRTAVSNYENGLTEPSITILAKMATIFETSIDYLIGRTD